ncbi:hypothetical protein AQUCO_03400098v1 [Aquilegia coerulea]|uniref:Rab-GAP TBC domain-containing protein n=1 Tax=Aquilegia coerulea TaxID=218851 RepID=A0A2G5CXG5_AQUCA|nr:hypothetical protein AQUCO_03400098v1 [Aquilegia coerulea]
MVKKSVPEWLNYWSSNPSPEMEDRVLRYSTKSSSTTTTIANESPIEETPPIPEPPPPPQQKKQEEEEEEQNSIQQEEDNDDYRRNNSTSSVSAEEISRQSQLLAELSRKVINMLELRRLASQGIPDGAGIRSTVWKLLLGYLPVDRGHWAIELAKKRAQYKHFIEELLVNPSEITRKMERSGRHETDESKLEEKGFLPRSEIPQGEHPLSLGKTSIWNQFFQVLRSMTMVTCNFRFLTLAIQNILQTVGSLYVFRSKDESYLFILQDTEIIEQIDRDVMRTHPDMHFFSGDSALAKSNQEALRRILIIFAKLNPGIRYVQGMNEVLAPLFYVFRNDPDEGNAVSAEADTFFCFVELLSGFRDHFCQQLDNSVVGIRSTITKMSQLLKEHDEELWRHLEITTKVNPQFYAFRWITLLLTQEFNFADSLHIWDTLLSDPEGPQETLLRVCCAMLILIRRRLLAGDFTSNLKLLQHYPSSNITHLLYVADKLRARSVG